MRHSAVWAKSPQSSLTHSAVVSEITNVTHRQNDVQHYTSTQCVSECVGFNVPLDTVHWHSMCHTVIKHMTHSYQSTTCIINMHYVLCLITDPTQRCVQLTNIKCGANTT